MEDLSITTLALLVLTPLLVWRVYNRIKARMTRQRSIVSRHYTGVLVFGAMIVVPLLQLFDRLPNLAALMLGSAVGFGWSVYALTKTRFEDTPQGYYFTPPARLGIVMAMILVARIFYLGVEIYANQGKGIPAPKLTDDAITMLCVGLTAGYFEWYSMGLLQWRRKLRKAIDVE
ncbi:hypothetical protein [Massilia sp. 9I]|uniref:hypothetical protein n=1 Tax=Massilia sp. 9I TaxID=2653152 RepID=UPI0012EF3DD7|nr:hypothetical protein [Massilia sp. 9I]VXB62383.1 conserved membrane hypothetical protein [Massilia sp. 9I]